MTIIIAANHRRHILLKLAAACALLLSHQKTAGMVGAASSFRGAGASAGAEEPARRNLQGDDACAVRKRKDCGDDPACSWYRGSCATTTTTPGPTTSSPTTAGPTASPVTHAPTTSPTTANPTMSPTKAPTDAPVSSSGLAQISDLQYDGAFRLKPGNFGSEPDGSCASSQATHCSANYAVGTLAHNPDRNSLFVVGHAQANYVAEYPLDGVVPDPATFDVSSLPATADPLQPFSPILGESAPNPENHNRITGLLCRGNELLVNSEDWYDAAADNVATTLVVRDSSDLSGAVGGYFEADGRANAAGYMGTIPADLRSLFGGAGYYTGWSSVYSITSRYSQGPSLWTFDPSDMTGTEDGPVSSTPYMNFPYGGGSGAWLSPTATSYEPQGTTGPFPPADPIWNALTRGMYGFFVPGTRTFMVIGSTGGLTSGIGYKAVQSNGNTCGGPCAYDPDDYYNYYWLFDAEEIANASDVWDPRPYDYGIWDLPPAFVTSASSNLIIGGTVDEAGGVLYVALANAARVGAYDRPPLILTYRLPGGNSSDLETVFD